MAVVVPDDATSDPRLATRQPARRGGSAVEYNPQASSLYLFIRITYTYDRRQCNVS